MTEVVETSEEREEAQEISADTALEDAEALLRTRPHGVLCTLSKRADGAPFGSVAPYAVDRQGRPILLIATIAEHTRNVKADPRVSLLIHGREDGNDIQTKARLNVMGRAERVPEADVADSRARYLARLPEAVDYFRTHDFVFYRVSVGRLRYIGGFGRIFWLKPARYQARIEGDPVAAAAESILDHMNEDHRDTLGLYCRAFREVDPGTALMVGVDRWGFDVDCRDPDVRLRFEFQRAATVDNLRPMVVAMAEAARRKLGITK